MSKFAIEVRHGGVDDPSRPVGVAVRADGHVLSQLIREGANHPDEFVRGSPVSLAFWLVDNWWRLRWEAVPTAGATPAWRLAHEMSSVGGGCVWPRVSIWGSGEQVGLASRSDPPGVTGPVRYLTDALLFVPAKDFETGVDTFLASVFDGNAESATDLPALRSQLEALNAERRDPDTAVWRRFEARLGYDVDEAPEGVIEALAELAKQYGRGGVEEAAAAAPGPESASTLTREIEVVGASKTICDLSHAVKVCPPVKGKAVGRPWKLAESMARRLRRGLSLGDDPINNPVLSDILGVTSTTLTSQGPARDIPYSLRVGQPAAGKVRVALRDSYPLDRRFDLMRVLGDAIWARQDMLGPVAASKTDRQVFQRAFAQSVLCPFELLRAFLPESRISEGAISAAARHFLVSERVVRTLLVNKKMIPRSEIMPAAWRDYSTDQFSDLLEAA